MENIGREPHFIDSKLKRLFLYYLLSGILFIGVLSSGILLDRYLHSLHETSSKLKNLKISLIKMRDATSDLRKCLSTVKTIIPYDLSKDSPEKLILFSLDALKMLMKDAEIAISEIEYKETEVNLPVTISGVAGDYSAIVNNVGYLESMKFPFFTITNLSIKKSDEPGKRFVVYEIKGVLRVLKGASDTESPGVPKEGLPPGGRLPPPKKLSHGEVFKLGIGV
jgi:hypothetical protein